MLKQSVLPPVIIIVGYEVFGVLHFYLNCAN